ncbi:MAG: GNAT family N-acetyltransferase [Thermoleophilia bacterium]|nr:GNAT family N-acetyltransferase [Thermoleophilia bacterium]
MVVYRDGAEGLEAEQLVGFFVGWRASPSPERHLEALRGSDHVVLALDDARGSVVGFVTAVSDGVLAAYVPLLEVRPEYQGRGIGSELMRRLLARLEGLYMVDLACDEPLVPFYERLGFRRGVAMAVRDPDALAGETGGPGREPG